MSARIDPIANSGIVSIVIYGHVAHVAPHVTDAVTTVSSEGLKRLIIRSFLPFNYEPCHGACCAFMGNRIFVHIATALMGYSIAGSGFSEFLPVYKRHYADNADGSAQKALFGLFGCLLKSRFYV